MLWAFMSAYGIASIIAFGQTATILSFATTAAVVLAATRHLRATSLYEALLYGIGWAMVHILLDLIFITPAAGTAALFTQSLLISYGIVLATPFFYVFVSLVHTRNAKTISSTQSEIVVGDKA